MKKVLLIVPCVLAALVSVLSAASSTEYAALFWFAAIVFAALAVLIVRRKPKAGDKTDATAAQATSKKPYDPPVYFVRKSNVYHSSTLCPHIYGHKSMEMARSKAKRKGMKPCKSCSEYGD